MHPVLLSTPWFNIYSYGFMVAVGYTLAMCVAIYHAKRNGLDTGAIFDMMLLQFVVGIFGSRLLFVMEYIPDKFFTSNLFDFEQGGMTFYGSVITGFVADLIFLKIKGIPFWKAIDCVGLCLGPGIAVSRFGCFFNGCCYGIACSPEIGFQFRAAGEGYFHATQLYESGLCLVAFAIILLIKKYFTHYGEIFLTSITLYSFFRFFVEFLRAENPVFLFGMTLSQVLSIIFIAISIITWSKNRKNRELEIMPEMSVKEISK